MNLSGLTHFIATLFIYCRIVRVCHFGYHKRHGYPCRIVLHFRRGAHTALSGEYYISFPITRSSPKRFIPNNRPAYDLCANRRHIYSACAHHAPSNLGVEHLRRDMGLALTGIIIKGFRLGLPRWFPAVFYLLMGWLIVIAFVPLRDAIPRKEFFGLFWEDYFTQSGQDFLRLTISHQKKVGTLTTTFSTFCNGRQSKPLLVYA